MAKAKRPKTLVSGQVYQDSLSECEGTLTLTRSQILCVALDHLARTLRFTPIDQLPSYIPKPLPSLETPYPEPTFN